MLIPHVHLAPYGCVQHVESEDGFIIWRTGTGLNVELLNLQVVTKRQGGGKKLLLRMLRELQEYPPYATVFGFTRTINTDAQAFYREMGFTLSMVQGVYADGTAVVFSASYKGLIEKHLGG